MIPVAPEPFGVPPIPLGDRDYALTHGVGAEGLQRLWRTHCEGSQEKGFASVGGLPWRRYVEGAVRRANAEVDAPTLTPEARIATERRALEAKTKAIQAAAYDRDAVSLHRYLGALDTKRNPTPMELVILETPIDLRGRDVAGALMAVFTNRQPARVFGVCGRCGRRDADAKNPPGFVETRPEHFARCSCPRRAKRDAGVDSP